MPQGTQDYSPTKKAFQNKLTEEHVEHLRKCVDPQTGPAYFMANFVKIQHPVKGGIKFEPFEFRKD